MKEGGDHAEEHEAIRQPGGDSAPGRRGGPRRRGFRAGARRGAGTWRGPGSRWGPGRLRPGPGWRVPVLGRPGCGPGQGGGYGRGQGGGYGRGAGDQLRQRDRIHVDGTQRQRLQDCNEGAQRLRQHAQEIGANAGNPAFAAMERDQLRIHSETIFRQHDEFVAGLAKTERDQLERPLGRLEQTRSLIEAEMRTLDRALDANDPDAKRIARASRELERQLDRWEIQYRNFSSLFGSGD